MPVKQNSPKDHNPIPTLQQLASLGLLNNTLLSKGKYKELLDEEVNKQTAKFKTSLEKSEVLKDDISDATIKAFEVTTFKSMCESILRSVPRETKVAAKEVTSNHIPTLLQLASCGLLTSKDLLTKGKYKELIDIEVNKHVEKFKDSLAKITVLEKDVSASAVEAFRRSTFASICDAIIKKTPKNEQDSSISVIPVLQQLATIGLLEYSELLAGKYKKLINDEVLAQTKKFEVSLTQAAILTKPNRDKAVKEYESVQRNKLLSAIKKSIPVVENTAEITIYDEINASLVFGLQRLIDSIKEYFDQYYKNEAAGVFNGQSFNIKEIDQRFDALRKFSEHQFTDPDTVKIAIKENGSLVNITHNNLMVYTELGEFENLQGLRSPYVEVSVDIFGKVNLSKLDKNRDLLLSHFNGVKCVLLKKSGSETLKHQEVYRTLVGWFVSSDIKLLTAAETVEQDETPSFEALLQHHELAKCLGLGRAVKQVASACIKVLALEANNSSFNQFLSQQRSANTYSDALDDIDNNLKFLEVTLTNEVSRFCEKTFFDLDENIEKKLTKVQKRLEKDFIAENFITASEEKATETEEKKIIDDKLIDKTAKYCRTSLEDVFTAQHDKYIELWGGGDASLTRKISGIRKYFLMPSFETQHLNTAGFLNDSLRIAFNQEHVVAPVSTDGYSNILDLGLLKLADKEQSNAFKVMSISKPIVFKSLLTTAAQMPMKILGPIFAIGGITMMLGLGNLIKAGSQEGVGVLIGQIGTIPVLLIVFIIFFKLAYSELRAISKQKTQNEMKLGLVTALNEFTVRVNTIKANYQKAFRQGVKSSVDDFMRRIRVHIELRRKDLVREEDIRQAHLAQSIANLSEQKEHCTHLTKNIQTLLKDVDKHSSKLEKELIKVMNGGLNNG